ncbi:MAG TPA: DUF92 domain-containing protein [Gemmatimonadaceae bacterium]|jgi:uncharacterized protein (TIGR00297 family)|nr:DUF92 domain-containing protein [Gemmatimonadaceae bacterium]
MSNLIRPLAGLALATLIALLARRARALSASGAVAAVVVGTAAVAAGWDWGALLIAFFVASSLLSGVARGARAEQARALAAKGNERDAVQVLANGGLFALAALAMVAFPRVPATWQAVGAGALAAAAGDTWATEIGILSPRAPVSIATLRRVPAGTSGGVSALGLLGGVIGAAFVELCALLLGWPERVAVAAVAGGVAGMLMDSILGATLQQRRWCDTCNAPTERVVHGCGAQTRIRGGLPWLTNDGVNVACTVTGALVAWLVVGAA